MTLTLLIDLDDTLLNNDIDVFIPVYLKALGKHLRNSVTPETMIPSLLAATQVMQKNNNPALSLEGAFDQAFYPAIGQRKNELRPLIEQFYDEIFPCLNTLTSPRPEAASMITKVIEQGHQVVIATNPLFPRKAILHRLRWAGLDPDLIPFSLITSYEGFHFAKPNPAYFAEIVAQSGYPNQPAVMVGNSLQDDLVPADQLGMPVFWVTPDHAQLPAGFHPLSASGSLDEITVWLEKVDAAGIRPEIKTPAGLLAVLKSTPAAFDTLQKGLTIEQWRLKPEPDEWSLTEIFCHLRDVDREVNIPRFVKIIREDNPFVVGIDTDPWAEEREYRNSDGPTALRAYTNIRNQMVTLLESAKEEDWHRPARHAIFGPTDLAELVSFVTIHDRSHVQQAFTTAQRV